MQYFQILIAPHKYPNDKETKTKNNCHYSFIAQPKYNLASFSTFFSTSWKTFHVLNFIFQF